MDDQKQGWGGQIVKSTPTPVPTGTGPSGGGRAALLRSTYQSILKAKGVPYLSYNDPALLMAYQAIGGLNQQQALAVAQQMSDYYKAHGYSASDQELEAALQQAGGPTTGQGTSPIPGVGAQIRQDYQDLLRSRGVTSLPPNDPQLIAAIKFRIPGMTDEQAVQVAQQGRDWFATTGTLAPDSVIDRAAGQAKGFSIPLPHQFDPAKFDAITRDPVGAGLLQAQVEAAGWDWNTYKQQHLAARPTGVAAPSSSVSWGSTGQGSNQQGVWG